MAVDAPAPPPQASMTPPGSQPPTYTVGPDGYFIAGPPSQAGYQPQPGQGPVSSNQLSAGRTILGPAHQALTQALQNYFANGGPGANNPALKAAQGMGAAPGQNYTPPQDPNAFRIGVNNRPPGSAPGDTGPHAPLQIGGYLNPASNASYSAGADTTQTDPNTPNILGI